jgi:hypothetical protein
LTATRNVASLLGSVREEEIHSMVEYNIDPARYAERPIQIASRLSTAKDYMRSGMPAPTWLHMPLFTHLSSTSSAGVTAVGGGDEDDATAVAASLGTATSLADCVAILTDAIRNKLSKLLSIPVENARRFLFAFSPFGTTSDAISPL